MKQTKEEVIEAIQTTHVELEEDREWLWVTTDVGPVHQVKGGCKCPECLARAEKREVLKLAGFRFSYQPHLLKSGKSARWGNSCLAPTRFKKGKGKSNGQPVGQNQTNGNESPQVDEDAAAFFEQV